MLQKVDIYVDGSYIEGKVGYGAIILNEGEVITQFCGGVSPERAENTRQVAGELVGVGKALQWCKENDVKDIHIYYDYKGIECWATGKWKANLNLTQNYARFMKQFMIEGYRITFHKVKSHSGNRWNEAVDQLAKAGALGLDPNDPTQTVPSAPASSAAPAVKKTENTTPNPKTEEARHKALKFASYLRERNIEAIYDQIYNDMYARLKITMPHGTAFFDLYNTKNKPLVPYLHNFKKEGEMKNRIERFWNEFIKQ